MAQARRTARCRRLPAVGADSTRRLSSSKAGSTHPASSPASSPGAGAGVCWSRETGTWDRWKPMGGLWAGSGHWRRMRHRCCRC
nr:MAG TPA: hypothetical protein [Caudoviricetes sp.]